MVSVNAHPDDCSDDERLRKLKTRVGADKVPHDVDPKRLAGWDLAEVSRRIMFAEVEETINTRNGELPQNVHLRYKQLFNFNYRDGARMLTTGGLVYDMGQDNVVDYCGFNQLDFVREGSEPYEIVVPNLTFREMRHIDAQLPPQSGGVNAPVGEKDVEAYTRIYRYFPRFVEAEL